MEHNANDESCRPSFYRQDTWNDLEDIMKRDSSTDPMLSNTLEREDSVDLMPILAFLKELPGGTSQEKAPESVASTTSINEGASFCTQMASMELSPFQAYQQEVPPFSPLGHCHDLLNVGDPSLPCLDLASTETSYNVAAFDITDALDDRPPSVLIHHRPPTDFGVYRDPALPKTEPSEWKSSCPFESFYQPPTPRNKYQPVEGTTRSRKRNASMLSIKSESPSGECIDEYRARREKNNKAVRASREKKKAELHQKELKCVELERVNSGLRTRISHLEKQLQEEKTKNARIDQLLHSQPKRHKPY